MLIPLVQLEAHPGNANVMPAALLAKLESHVRGTGRYPPLIVRPLPATAPAGAAAAPVRYQILDGHHRALVLRRLGADSANCDVWHDIDDERASLLLLTLNRLRGEDDPVRRGALLADLAQRHELPPESLSRLLPDDADRIERLIDLACGEPPSVVDPGSLPDPASVPQAVTFFLTPAQRSRLLDRLRAVHHDRHTALLRALGLDDQSPAPRVN